MDGASGDAKAFANTVHSASLDDQSSLLLYLEASVSKGGDEKTFRIFKKNPLV